MNNISQISGSWKSSLETLKAYVAFNEHIRIEERRINIDDESRDEFYSLFNKVRTEFVNDRMTEYLSQAKELAAQYRAVRDFVLQTYNLKEITLNAETARFLESPEEEVRRPLLDPLFQILAGTKDLSVLEEESLCYIRHVFAELYIDLYETWLFVAIIKAAKAKQLYSVSTMRLDSMRFRGVMTSRMSDNNTSAVAEPQVASTIDFSRRDIYQFVVPNVIMELDDSFMAMRIGLPKGLYNAQFRSPSREWVTVTPVSKREYQRSILVYTSDNIKDISLIADESLICQPDFIITNNFVKSVTDELEYRFEPNLPAGVTARSRTFVNSLLQVEKFPEAIQMNKQGNTWPTNLNLYESRISELVNVMLQPQFKTSGNAVPNISV
jgi:hypothetical protein